MTAHPILDAAALHGFTLRGWILRKAEGCRRVAQALRADAGTQAEPEARAWVSKAQVLEELLAEMEDCAFTEKVAE